MFLAEEIDVRARLERAKVKDSRGKTGVRARLKREKSRTVGEKHELKAISS